MHGKLIKAILKKYNLTQQQLANELGFKKGFMSEIARDKAKIPKDKFPIFIEKYKVNKLYLYSGEGVMFTDEDLFTRYEHDPCQQDVIETFGKNLKETEDCIPIPYYSIGASAGAGTWLLGEDVDKKQMFFDKIFIEKILRANPKNLHIIFADGDSMSPTIKDKDLLIIDTSKIDINTAGVYVFKVNNELRVKRLSKKINGNLEIISDNEKYDKEILKSDDDIYIEIIGKVIRNESKDDL